MKNFDIELILIGNILTDYIPVDYILSSIKSEYFSNEETRVLFDNILELIKVNGKADIVLLLKKLKQKNYIVEKYRDLISKAVNESIHNYAFDEYVNILQNRYINRQFTSSLKKYLSKTNEDNDVIGYINQLTSELTNIQRSVNDVGNNIEEIVDEFNKLLIMRRQNKDKKFTTFTMYNNLDKILGVNNFGELIIIAGRPGLGKTSFALNIVSNLIHNKIKSSFFTIEMGRVSILERMISIMADINNILLQKGLYEIDDLGKISESGDKIKEYFILNDKTNSIEDISNLIVKQNIQYGIKNFFIDYLQLITTEKKGYNKNEEIGYITRNLSITARKYEVNIFLLSQLNRQIEHREDKTPTLADLRDSGAIESDASKIIFLYCKDKNYSVPNWDIDILVAKNRNGDVGKSIFIFERPKLKFIEKEGYNNA